MRGWIRERVGWRGSPYEPITEIILVVANELAENAIRHTGSGQPGGTFTLVLRWDATVLRVTGGDQGGVTVPQARHLTLTEETGRGLQLVSYFCQWATAPSAFGRDVWADFYADDDYTDGVSPSCDMRLHLIEGLG